MRRVLGVPCQREPFVLALPSVDSVAQILQSPSVSPGESRAFKLGPG